MRRVEVCSEVIEAGQVRTFGRKDQKVHCSYIEFDLTTRCPAKRCQRGRLRDGLGWRGELAMEKYISPWHSSDRCASE